MNQCNDCHNIFPVPNVDGGCPFCNSQDTTELEGAEMTEKSDALRDIDKAIEDLANHRLPQMFSHRQCYFTGCRSQQDADVAYYEPIIRGLRVDIEAFSHACEVLGRKLEQARQDTAREIFEEIESWKYVSPANLYQCTMNEIIEKLEQSLKEKFGVK